MTITPRRIFWPAQRIAGQTAGCRFDTEMPKTGVRRSPFSSVRSLAATKTESCVRPRPATPSRHAPRKQVRGASAKATPHRATMRSANPNQRNRTGICKQGECRSCIAGPTDNAVSCGGKHLTRGLLEMLVAIGVQTSARFGGWMERTLKLFRMRRPESVNRRAAIAASASHSSNEVPPWAGWTPKRFNFSRMVRRETPSQRAAFA